MRARLGWTNGTRSKVNGVVEGKEEGWVFSQPAPLSSFSLKPEQWGPVKNEPKDMGIGDWAWASHQEVEMEGGGSQSEQTAAMSNLHLKLNPPPSGTQIKTSYLCSPSLPAWERSPAAAGRVRSVCAGKGGGGVFGWVGPIYTSFLSEKVYERGGQRWWASIWDRLIKREARRGSGPW